MPYARLVCYMGGGCFSVLRLSLKLLISLLLLHAIMSHAIMLNAIMLHAIMLHAIMLHAIMLHDIMLHAIMITQFDLTFVVSVGVIFLHFSLEMINRNYYQLKM